MYFDQAVNKKVRDVINWKKGEAHAMEWLYTEVDDAALMEELNIAKKYRSTVQLAMTNCLLEGDKVLVDNKDFYAVRYYTDVLNNRTRTIDL